MLSVVAKQVNENKGVVDSTIVRNYLLVVAEVEQKRGVKDHRHIDANEALHDGRPVRFPDGDIIDSIEEPGSPLPLVYRN